MSQTTILSNVLIPDPSGFDPNSYWISGNQNFDLGFLPP
jgi:hypothetical protein